MDISMCKDTYMTIYRIFIKDFLFHTDVFYSE